MAEGLLKAKLKDKECKYQISSAGIAALINEPAAEPARYLMQKRDIDISKHRAKQLTVEQVTDNDLIFTMDSQQRQYILKRYPFACGKTFLIGEAVPDPYRKTERDFEIALEIIEEGIRVWLQKLCIN